MFWKDRGKEGRFWRTFLVPRNSKNLELSSFWCLVKSDPPQIYRDDSVWSLASPWHPLNPIVPWKNNNKRKKKRMSNKPRCYQHMCWHMLAYASMCKLMLALTILKPRDGHANPTPMSWDKDEDKDKGIVNDPSAHTLDAEPSPRACAKRRTANSVYDHASPTKRVDQKPKLFAFLLKLTMGIHGYS